MSGCESQDPACLVGTSHGRKYLMYPSGKVSPCWRLLGTPGFLTLQGRHCGRRGARLTVPFPDDWAIWVIGFPLCPRRHQTLRSRQQRLVLPQGGQNPPRFASRLLAGPGGMGCHPTPSSLQPCSQPCRSNSSGLEDSRYRTWDNLFS